MSQKIELKTGLTCNNRCLFCIQGEAKNKIADKTLEEVKCELLKGRKTSKEVVFSGGEPTLRLSELILMIKYAKELGYKTIGVNSNGRIFAYIDFCKIIISAGMDIFATSLHGHTAGIHDFLTSSQGSFRQTTQGIKNLKKLGHKNIFTNTVITMSNYKVLPRIAELLVDLDVDLFQFAFPHISGSAYKNKDWLVPSKTKIMSYVKDGLDIGIKAGKRVMTDGIPYCFMKGYEKYVGENMIYEKKVLDSNFIVEKYGNFQRQKKLSNGPMCSKCKYFDICGGPWKEYPEIFGWKEFKPVNK